MNDFAAFAFVLALIAIAVIDLFRRVIPDEITLSGTALSLLYAAWTSRQAFMTSLSGLAAGLALALGVYALGNLFFKTHIRAARQSDPDIDSAFGMGDVKFMAFAGAFLGPAGAFHTLLIASVLAAIIGVILKFTKGASVIPFGPFLTFAAATSLSII